MRNLFCNIAAKRVGMRCCTFLSPTNQPGLATNQVVVNLICCTGLNVGGKTRNIVTIASLKKVSFLFLSSKVYLERSVILFVF